MIKRLKVTRITSTNWEKHFKVGDILKIDTSKNKFKHNGKWWYSNGVNECGSLDGFGGEMFVEEAKNTEYSIYKVVDSTGWNQVKNGDILVLDNTTEKVISHKLQNGRFYLSTGKVNEKGYLYGFGEWDNLHVKVEVLQ